jgi:hypothetical protein
MTTTGTAHQVLKSPPSLLVKAPTMEMVMMMGTMAAKTQESALLTETTGTAPMESRSLLSLPAKVLTTETVAMMVDTTVAKILGSVSLMVIIGTVLMESRSPPSLLVKALVTEMVVTADTTEAKTRESALLTETTGTAPKALRSLLTPQDKSLVVMVITQAVTLAAVMVPPVSVLLMVTTGIVPRESKSPLTLREKNQATSPALAITTLVAMPRVLSVWLMAITGTAPKELKNHPTLQGKSLVRRPTLVMAPAMALLLSASPTATTGIVLKGLRSPLMPQEKNQVMNPAAMVAIAVMLEPQNVPHMEITGTALKELKNLLTPPEKSQVMSPALAMVLLLSV